MTKIQIKDKKHPFTVDMLTVMKFEELSGKPFAAAFGDYNTHTDLFYFFYAAFLIGAQDEGKEFPYTFTDLVRHTPEWGIFPAMKDAYAEGVGKLGKALDPGASQEKNKA